MTYSGTDDEEGGLHEEALVMLQFSKSIGQYMYRTVVTICTA